MFAGGVVSYTMRGEQYKKHITMKVWRGSLEILREIAQANDRPIVRELDRILRAEMKRIQKVEK